jgi:hypothetical protein
MRSEIVGKPVVDNQNERIAQALSRIAELLEEQAANPFRVRAYRNAASTIRQLSLPIGEILEREGTEGLVALPGIGRSLAHSIAEFVHTGRLPLLQRLEGHDYAEHLFQTVPGIGPELARRIHDQLGVETLQELHAAATDGRLATVQGMGSKRLRAVEESLSGRFRGASESRPAKSYPASTLPPDVTVEELLDVDREYRDLAAKGRLPRIAPRRFNPTREAWLPVLHTRRGGREYTALFSNTIRAHEMGTTRDWVVIYRDDSGDRGRWTVITAAFGPLAGYRIVRGLEPACAVHYQVPSAAHVHQVPQPESLLGGL